MRRGESETQAQRPVATAGEPAIRSLGRGIVGRIFSVPNSTDSADHRDLRYSIVVPVFNEGKNIGSFCRAAKQQLRGAYELLICYDFDEDNTLPALAA